jgi:sec-independent protein translocase protein TatC
VSADEKTDEEPDQHTMTLTEHLGELRVRIIRSALAVAIAMVLVVAFYDPILEFLKQPYVDLCNSKPPDFCDPELNSFTPTEGLATRLRVGMYGGIIIALPVLLWQTWRFIVPALNRKE